MKSNPNITIESYGIYTKWNSANPEIPKIIKYTTTIPIEPESEFGLILSIKKMKNSRITFQIDHPGWIENGEKVKPFKGEEFIKSNDYRYYVGDRFWEPYENKAGEWTITVWIDNKHIISKTFTAIIP